MNELKVKLLINGGFVFALLILVALGWLNHREVAEMEGYQHWEHHTYAMARQYDELLIALYDMETGERGFIITGKNTFLEPYRRAMSRIDPITVRLRELDDADPRHASPMGGIEPLVREIIALARTTVELRKTSGFDAAHRLVATERGRELMGVLHSRIAAARNQEEQLLRELRLKEIQCLRETRLVLTAGTILSMSLLVVVFLLLRREIRQRAGAEEELRRHRDHLEELIRERTGQLEQAKQAAEAANLAKSVFLANMSHEMLTPLSRLAAVLDLLLTEGPADGQHRRLETARSSADSLKGLINNILDYCEFSSGTMEVAMRPFDLLRCLRSVAAVYGARAESKGLRFLLEIDERTPSWVVGDEERLRQALGNLLDNAVKFTREGEVAVSAGLTREPDRPDPEVLLFTVRDTGPGIPAEYLDNMFDMFTQADISSRKTFSGVGLGLALTRRIVESLGGTIRGENRPGQGSVFTFTLPLIEKG